MKKFELDANYDNGRLLVVARTDNKVIFLRDGLEFFVRKITVKDGIEHAFNISANNNAVITPAHRDDIKEFIALAYENLEYVRKEYDDFNLELDILNVIKQLRKRLRRF